MSDAPNQKPITSFFQAPKRSRPIEADEYEAATTDNRPSKLSRPIHIRDSDSQSESETNRNTSISIQDNLNEDKVLSTMMDSDGNEIFSIEISSSSSHSTNTATKETLKGRVYLWKNEYRQLFKWLEYDELKGTAQCSYSSCKMYANLCEIANKRSWGKTEMARYRFEQHEKTQKHMNHGRKPGQTAVTKYAMDKPTISHSDNSIAIRIQTAWWLANEDVAIMKFGSLLKSTLITHEYDFLIPNYSLFEKN